MQKSRASQIPIKVMFNKGLIMAVGLFWISLLRVCCTRRMDNPHPWMGTLSMDGCGQSLVESCGGKSTLGRKQTDPELTTVHTDQLSPLKFSYPHRPVYRPPQSISRYVQSCWEMWYGLPFVAPWETWYNREIFGSAVVGYILLSAIFLFHSIRLE